MAVSITVNSNAPAKFANKEADWNSDTFKVTLHTSAYVPNQDTHDYANDLTNEVANGNGYTTGGATLTNCTATVTGKVTKLDADDISWPASTITARYAVIQCTTPGSAATNPIIATVDFGADQVSSAGAFTITWAAGGICTFTVS